MSLCGGISITEATEAIMLLAEFMTLYLLFAMSYAEVTHRNTVNLSISFSDQSDMKPKEASIVALTCLLCEQRYKKITRAV